MNRLGKVAVALAMAFSVGAAGAAALINIPEGATQAEIVQALAEVDEGGTVALAADTYVLTDTITLSRNVTLKGAGRDATILDFGKLCRGFTITEAGATVADLTIKDAKDPTGAGGGVNMTKGLVENCRITGCLSDKSHGGGAYMTGGTIRGTQFENCIINALYQHGNAVYLNGSSALVSNCVMTANNGGYSHSTPAYGDAVVYLNSGTVAASRIYGNDKASTPGVHQANGTLVNCLIYGNTGKNGSAGILKDNGTTAYCTVYGNVLTGDTSGLSGIRQTNGKTFNCIFYGNGPVGGTAGSCNVTGGTFVSNVVDVALVDYPDNFVGDPKFRDAAGCDFTIANRASPAYGRAAPTAVASIDLDGRVRDASKPTIGCYEYDPSKEEFAADIAFDQKEYPEGGIATARAVAMGAGEAEVSYAWYVDGAPEPASTEAEPSFPGLTPGRHSLQLVITADGRTAEAYYPTAFDIKPLKVYVNDFGSGTYPYDSPETATDSPSEAFLALWKSVDTVGELAIAAGTYKVTADIVALYPVRITGAGTNETTLVGTGTITRGFHLNSDGAELSDVTLSNMVGQVSGGAVCVSKGAVRRCHITKCTTSVQSVSGAGISLTGGTFVDSTVSKCGAKGTYGYGAVQVNGSGVVVSNVVIRNCEGGTNGEWNRGVGLYLQAGLVTHSRIVDNGSISLSQQAAGVRHDGGTLRNCLVAGNKSSGHSAGVYMSAAGAKMQFCTVYGNVVAGDASGFSGLRMANGTATDNVISGNGPEGGSAGSCNVTGGTFTRNVIDMQVDYGAGNVAADPKFADAANGDFHPQNKSSPLVDKGEPNADVTTDIEGFVRDETPDIGAYEYDKSKVVYSVNIDVDGNVWRAGSSPEARAVVEGAPDEDDMTFAWKLDDVPQTETSGTLTLENLALGNHTLYVSVTSAGQVRECTATNVFSVLPAVVYVDEKGGNRFPYATEEDAATSFNDAFAALWKSADSTGVVHVAAGEYALTAAVALNQPVRIVGAGRDLTCVTQGEGFEGVVFTLNNTAAYLSDITVTNFVGNERTKGLSIQKGQAERIRVTGLKLTCASNTSLPGGGVSMSGGLLLDSEIDHVTASATYVRGAGLFFDKGGIVSNCVIRNCSGSGSTAHSFANGVFMDGGGLLVNSKILDNGSATAKVTDGGVRLLSGATLRNCLVAGNLSEAGASGVMANDGCTIENCTIAGNEKEGMTQTVQVSVTGKAVVRNTAIWSTVDGLADLTAASETTVSHCRYKEATEDANGNTAADPLFRSPAKQDFRLRGGSPLRNAGERQGWMDGATDLIGNPRLLYGEVAIGCYTCRPRGLQVLVR